MTRPPLIVHAIHHLIMGGLENGLINLINRMPADRYRHAILCLERYSDFSDRLARDDVLLFSMDRKPGRSPKTFVKILHLLRKLQPSIVHSRNLSGLDAQFPAFLAKVPVRIHGEHGWHDDDPDGSSRKYQILRRLHRPFISQYVALSADLENYLREKVGVQQSLITRIHNGVDTRKFKPTSSGRERLPQSDIHIDERHTIIGYVGRFQGIKDPMNLAHAFKQLSEHRLLGGDRLRLVMVGDGPELSRVRRYIAAAGLAPYCWLPGARNDVPMLLRGMDLFVLPSKGEGISNTILEAMASGLPVVATRVGGNNELVGEGATGFLVDASDSAALAKVILRYLSDPELRVAHGRAGRIRVESEFSLEAMTQSYVQMYDTALRRAGIL